MTDQRSTPTPATLLDRMFLGRELRARVDHIGRGTWRPLCAVCYDESCEFCPAVELRLKAAA